MPALIRASFSMDTKEAKVGVEADVPATLVVCPW